MATYTELYGIRSNDALVNKVAVACTIQADVIRQEATSVTNHANRVIWAKASFSDPLAMANRMIWALLAANQGASVAAINGASDSAILTAVANAVDIFADGTN